MKNNSQIISQNKADSWFFWGICFILFLPIIILPPNFQPSDWNRTILFRIILTALISIFLFGFLYKKKLSFSIPKIKNRVYIPFFILLAFFATLILATIFSQDVRFSVFGSPSRACGLLNLLFFFVFVVFLTIFTKKNQWNKFFNLLFTAGVLASLLAIVQYFNIFKNIFLSYEGGRTPSFLGNSTFLAIYLLFLTFLSFIFLTQEKERKKKIIYAILFLLFAFTILITVARATYLGLLIGFFYFFFFYPVKLPEGQILAKPKLFNGVYTKIRILKIAAVSLLLIAVSVVFLFNFFPQFAEKNSLFKTAANMLSIKRVATDLTGTRFSAWKITLEAIKDKPWLGWGPENFYIGFEKYYDPTMSNLQRLWWDRPHNILLDVFANSGFLALVFYVVFWAALLWRLQIYKKKQNNGKNTYFAHGLQAMFIGYLTALFFAFDNFSTYLISFFFIGYSFYLLSEQSEQQEEKLTICPPKTLFFQKKPVIISFLIIIVLFVWFWNIKPLYLNEKIVYAQNLSKSKQCKKALEITNNENWGKAGILKSYAILKYSDVIRNCAFAKPDKEVEYSQKALSLLKTASKVQPKFSRTWLFMGGFANVLAAREENADNKNKLLLEARSELENALKLSPKRQEIIIEMEKNYLLAEDYQTMKRLAEDCVKIDESRGECYWYLGIAEIFLGDQENGKKHILEEEKKRYSTPPYIQLAVAYLSQKNYKDATDVYYILALNNPENASYHATLAFLLKQIGKYSEAGEEAIKVFKLQPENQEARKFLEQLLGLNPNNPTLHASLAYVYKQLGEEEKAKQEILIIKSIYLQLIVKYPKNPDYHFYLAGIYRELKEYEKALKEAEIALNLDPKLKEEFEEFRSATVNEKYEYEDKQRQLQK